MQFYPFSSQAVCIELPRLTIENSVDRVSFFGLINLEITKDREGLTRAVNFLKDNSEVIDFQVRDILLNAIRFLSSHSDLPDKLCLKEITSTINPFAS